MESNARTASNIRRFPLSELMTWPSAPGVPNPLTSEEWRWKAPEQMSIAEDLYPPVTMATDVWAFSMTVIEVRIFYHEIWRHIIHIIFPPRIEQIFTECVPFSYVEFDASVILFVVSGGRPKREHCPQISDDVWCILEQCWSPDPNRRLSMTAIFGLLGSQLTSLTTRL
jgi:serine/threonine protein kinase